MSFGVALALVIATVLGAWPESRDSDRMTSQVVALFAATEAPPEDGLGVPHYAPPIANSEAVTYLSVK